MWLPSSEPGTPICRAVLRNAKDVAEVERNDPLSLLPGKTIYEALKHVASLHPSKAAIVQLRDVDDDDPDITTFSSYLDKVERAANLFRAASHPEPTVVAVVAPYLPEALISMWAGATVGHYVPINPFLEFEHVAGIMNAAKATVLVIATAKAGPGAWDNLDALCASVPTLKRTWLIDAAEAGEDDFAASVAASQAGGLEFAPQTSPEAECAYLHTGGTTATPKLVRHTHGSQLLQGWLCGVTMGVEADAVVGHAMPNFHVGGAVAMGTRAIVFGQTLLTLTAAGFRNPAIVPAFWDIVARHGMTSITTAPTTAAAIIAADKPGPATLRYFTTGGGPLPSKLARSFEQRYGLPLREVWGGTEFHGILSFHYGGDARPVLGSCGRAVPFHRVISAILEGNKYVREAGPDERGILIACGPAVTPGYVDPAADRQFFIEGGPDDERWATTGDVGAVDKDGYIWIYGREKDVIIRGGHNIDSAMIDDVLVTHPAVLYAAAVGKPCPLKGELPMAYVQLRPGASAGTADIHEFAKGRIQERAAVPVEIVVMDAIPMTAVGKVSKPPLRADAMRRVAEKVCAELAANEQVEVRVADERGQLTLQLEVQGGDEIVTRLAEAFAHFTFPTKIERVCSDTV